MQQDETIYISSNLDVMESWMTSNWIPPRADQEIQTLLINESCVENDVLDQIDPRMPLATTHVFAGAEPYDGTPLARIARYAAPNTLLLQTGASIYRFQPVADSEAFEVMVLSIYTSGDCATAECLAAVPRAHLPVWTAFADECYRIAYAFQPTSRVRIIGGRSVAFEPTVEWDDVILPAELKGDLQRDVQSFFARGVDVYRRLKLKPFRKIMLAGVPGTGKTMLCAALAKWALDQQFLVIYVSSADRNGATFWKIEQALAIASNSQVPTLIILEELDAYLGSEEKAMVLNVLDGSESRINDYGTLLICTTNYPEAIDDRVLKRPGRLDRIFIIPEARRREDADRLLRLYLGDLWQDDHAELVPKLVGYPGAFVREVAVHALTQVAYEDLADLPLAMLNQSFEGLRDQIAARDDFLAEREQPAPQANGSR